MPENHIHISTCDNVLHKSSSKVACTKYQSGHLSPVVSHAPKHTEFGNFSQQIYMLRPIICVWFSHSCHKLSGVSIFVRIGKCSLKVPPCDATRIRLTLCPAWFQQHISNISTLYIQPCLNNNLWLVVS